MLGLKLNPVSKTGLSFDHRIRVDISIEKNSFALNDYIDS